MRPSNCLISKNWHVDSKDSHPFRFAGFRYSKVTEAKNTRPVLPRIWSMSPVESPSSATSGSQHTAPILTVSIQDDYSECVEGTQSPQKCSSDVFVDPLYEENSSKYPYARDLYAFGMIILFVITGSTNVNILTEEGWPKELDYLRSVAARCLNPNFECRPLSADDSSLWTVVCIEKEIQGWQSMAYHYHHC